MNLKSKLTTFVFGFLMTTVSMAQTKKPIEYLGVPGPVIIDKVAYNLSWSSHPQSNYYKQEYLAKGENAEKFKKMVLLEVLTGEKSVKDLVAAKVADLKQMKASNPIVNYDVFQKDGEVIIDFLISANSPDGKTVSVVERNLYRYKTLVDKNGKKGVLLFAMSERAYGDDINNFLAGLKIHKSEMTNAVAGFKIPDVALVK